MCERGFDAVSMGDVAKRAGVNKALTVLTAEAHRLDYYPIVINTNGSLGAPLIPALLQCS